MKDRVLIIDDEEGVRSSLKMILEYEGYDCLLAANGEAGLKIVERESPDVVFLDIKMPNMDGMEVLRQIKAQDASLPVVMISGHADVRTAFEASKLGAFDFLEKPPESERLLVIARNAVAQHQLTRKVSRFRESQDVKHRLVGTSAALQKVRDAIVRAAPTNATVLITGESGVGKELVARAIHRNSLRKDEEFVQVNCAAIPEELIESELFGHEKGSFTGATEKQIGKFELADRGTIFLDEVGDMSAKTQAKVLRVLQEGEVERLGSSRTMKVDVRVIAATNKNLEMEIEEGKFREDLYFRLSVIPIHVPPLRERPDDIPILVRHFSELFGREGSLRAKRFSPAALEALSQHRWKGNIRELRNTVERLLIMTRGEVIDLPDLRGILQADMRGPAGLGAGAGAAGGGGEPARDKPGTLREFKETAERTFLV
ncbi:MAG TPA: sigma-54 dependent transcriptional regulator, partial [Vicinamibacteria bacterium]|nr:sigma-54 dependent transcriptional regulator [Vicinamibacteria bacterium]